LHFENADAPRERFSVEEHESPILARGTGWARTGLEGVQADPSEVSAIASTETCGAGLLTGFTRTIGVRTTAVVDTAARTPGDPVQSFATEMVALQGQLLGDPDFCTFNLRIGSDLGLASSLGNTVLTNLGGSSWNVESFFDTNYEITFQGCPGSVLEGFGGVTWDQLRLSTGEAPEAVPSLTVPSLALLGMLLAGSALYKLRRRATA